MKLYATVTSERATKGQGGKYLNIEVRDDNRQVVAFLYVAPQTDGLGGFKATITCADHLYLETIGENVRDGRKGKQQKDKLGKPVPCSMCRKAHNYWEDCQQ